MQVAPETAPSPCPTCRCPAPLHAFDCHELVIRWSAPPRDLAPGSYPTARDEYRGERDLEREFEPDPDWMWGPS